MTCEWCGSGRHPSTNCPTRNLVKYLLDEPPSDWDQKLPDMVVVTGEKQLIDELTQRSKIRSSEKTEDVEA